jgi:hypothetical protein
VPGDWIGDFRPLPGDPEAVRAELQIVTTRERRFGGRVVLNDQLLGGLVSFEVDGTVSASGQLSMIGAGAHGRLVAHGAEAPAGGALDARLRLTLIDGRVLDGTLRLVQSVGRLEPPQVITDWKQP